MQVYIIVAGLGYASGGVRLELAREVGRVDEAVLRASGRGPGRDEISGTEKKKEYNNIKKCSATDAKLVSEHFHFFFF